MPTAISPFWLIRNRFATFKLVTPVRAAHGTIEHVLIEYRAEGGDPFIEYETWIAADGAWCRRTVEGVPGRRVADTRLTLCRSSAGVVEVYLPAGNEILRTRPGAASGAETGGTPVGTAEKGWLTDDVVEQFRRDAVREEGTMTLDGHEYARLVTADGHDTVLVDPRTGEAVAWIPSPAAFGVPTTVVKTRRTLPDDAPSRRSLSLTELHPDAVVRDVTAAERERAIARQYPRG